MDDDVIDLLKFAGKLRQYSDADIQILRTKPLAEILDSADTLPDEPLANIIRLTDKVHSD